MIKIIPAIIAKSYEELEKMVRQVEPYVDRVQLDIMDGDFVPDKTISGYEELIKLETKLKFDVHLMVSKPEDQMYYWYKTGADNFLIQAETDHGHQDLIRQIHSNNRKAGLVLNPETPIEKIIELIDDIDSVQFMTVHPGAYGGEFVESVVDKIREFHNRYPNIPLAVDGAIHAGNIQKVIAAGASIIVLGSHIFSENRDVGEAIEEMKALGNNK